jgi:hypothetical protein
MKNSCFLFCFALLGASVAHAEVLVEKSCWSHAARGGSDKSIDFTLQTYRDTELDKEVGGFVRYLGSKETIPVAFKNFVRTDMDEDPEAGNYELTRVEIIDGKIGGEYVFAQVGFGIKQGRMVSYRKSKTAKPITFYHSTDSDGTCPWDKKK